MLYLIAFEQVLVGVEPLPKIQTVLIELLNKQPLSFNDCRAAGAKLFGDRNYFERVRGQAYKPHITACQHNCLLR